MLINTKIQFSIPKYCPECETKNTKSILHHVNALDTKAKIYMVFCSNPKCRFCREYKKCPNCGELLCL